LSSRETLKLVGVSIAEFYFLCDSVAGDVSFATILSFTLLGKILADYKASPKIRPPQ